jgi:anti-anti-sigma regulatory factor
MSGAIYSASIGGVEYLRFVGIIRYTQCAGLESYINHIFKSPEFAALAINLEQAEMLDSTALGLLARLSIEFKKISPEKPTILIQQGELAHILKRVCFDQVFNIVSKANYDTSIDYIELAPVNQNENQILNSVIEAHKSLAQISERNQSYFTDITKALK